MLLKLAVIGILLFLFYQDLRYRAVYWLLFPLLSVLFFLNTIRETSMAEVMYNSGLNLAFVLIQLLFLTLYFSIKKRKLLNISAAHLGWGDILFLLSLSFCFSPVNYILFYTLSLLLIVITVLIFLVKHRDKAATIPLAGLQALLMTVLLIFEMMQPQIKLSNDNWILSQLNL